MSSLAIIPSMAGAVLGGLIVALVFLATAAAISCFAWLGFKKVFVGVDKLFD